MSGGFQAPRDAEPPPWKDKKKFKPPPGQIPENAPEWHNRFTRVYVKLIKIIGIKNVFISNF